MTQPRVTPLPADQRDERTEELLAGLRGRSSEDMNLFATLARHPRVLKRWSAFGGTLLNGDLPARDREILIMRTAWNCRAGYEWAHHVPIAARAGLTGEEIARLGTAAAHEGWPAGEEALVRAADELHGDGVLGDATWKALADRYDDAQLIEVCMVVGQYHLVSFTVRSLGIEIEPGLDAMP
jgi:4-carboxymuconolactone decarboxylase